MLPQLSKYFLSDKQMGIEKATTALQILQLDGFSEPRIIFNNIETQLDYYMIVDLKLEFNHTQSTPYRRIINHFKALYVLGCPRTLAFNLVFAEPNLS